MAKPPAALLKILGIVVVVPGPTAKIARNTIDPVAVVEANGRHAVVSGPLECTLGEKAHVLVTVSQRTSGAVAEGRGFVACTGREETWAVEVVAQGKQRFDLGPATAVAIAWTVAGGETTDAHQWLVPVSLVAE